MQCIPMPKPLSIDTSKFFQPDTTLCTYTHDWLINQGWYTKELTTTVLLWCALGSGLPNDELSIDEPSVTCSPDFYEENSTCYPICQEWKTFSDGKTALIRVSATMATVVGILGGTAVILGSIIRYKSMWVWVKLLYIHICSKHLINTVIRKICMLENNCMQNVHVCHSNHELAVYTA